MKESTWEVIQEEEKGDDQNVARSPVKKNVKETKRPKK